MKTVRILVVAVAALACGGMAAAAPPTASDRLALEQLAAANDAAWSRKDWSAIIDQYAPAGTLRVSPAQEVKVGREAITGFFQASFARRPDGFRHVTRIEHIEMISPDAALADAYVRVERKQREGWQLVREFSNSSFVVREGGQWKLHSVRAYPLAAKSSS